MSAPRILFLTLSTFSTTGGIEKVGRIAGKALHDEAQKQGGSFRLFSMYDTPTDLLDKYLPAASFKGYAGHRLRFAKNAVRQGRKSTHVVLSHINLLSIGYVIKLLSPRTKVSLIAHGIEVWVKLSAWKIAALKRLDVVLPVSEFTRQRMIALYRLPLSNLIVVNNCLDPFLPPNVTAGEVAAVREKYGLHNGDKVLFTLARLSFSEQYKGYDKVIEAIPQVMQNHPSVKYLIAGKWDADEKQRLDALIQQTNLTDRVVFTGFVPDEEIAALFKAADVYVMPSTGEGFGVVFIEALFYGLPVIAGNKDGSVDALAGGRFGRLIDPDNKGELSSAITQALDGAITPSLNEVVSNFGFNVYTQKLAQAIGLSEVVNTSN